mmetsp:Transcript_7465/g.19276  ORF Transcript_7465/g.19276 Transcript_7465/m.19276 type:complete len:594 (-) Transcript_7465:88-1869(-)
MAPTSLLAGHLYKRGNAFPFGVVRRYVVLEDEQGLQQLVYYKKQGDAKPRGVIVLKDAMVTDLTGGQEYQALAKKMPRSTFPFAVYGESGARRTLFVFAAASSSEREEWMNKLRSVMSSHTQDKSSLARNMRKSIIEASSALPSSHGSSGKAPPSPPTPTVSAGRGGRDAPPAQLPPAASGQPSLLSFLARTRPAVSLSAETDQTATSFAGCEYFGKTQICIVHAGYPSLASAISAIIHQACTHDVETTFVNLDEVGMEDQPGLTPLSAEIGKVMRADGLMLVASSMCSRPSVPCLQLLEALAARAGRTKMNLIPGAVIAVREDEEQTNMPCGYGGVETTIQSVHSTYLQLGMVVVGCNPSGLMDGAEYASPLGLGLSACVGELSDAEYGLLTEQSISLFRTASALRRGRSVVVVVGGESEDEVEELEKVAVSVCQGVMEGGLFDIMLRRAPLSPPSSRHTPTITATEVRDAAAVVMGTAVRAGRADVPTLSLLESVAEEEGRAAKLVSKPFSAFAHLPSGKGGGENALLSLHSTALQLGMAVAGLPPAAEMDQIRNGTPLGLLAEAGEEGAGTRMLAESQGRTVAKAATALF